MLLPILCWKERSGDEGSARRASFGPFRRPALLALAWLLSSAQPVRAENPWQRISDKGGYLVEKRSVEGSPWLDLRVVTHSPLPPAQIFSAVTSHRRDDPTVQRMIKKYVVISESDHGRVLYEQLRAPVISDRDYTVRVEWQIDAARRLFEVRFQTDNAAGPPPEKGLVRMADIHGHWRIEADPAGGSRVEYMVHSEPGGSVPAWIARAPQIDSTRQNVVDTLGYAASHPVP